MNLSIIIPAFNEELLIESTVESISEFLEINFDESEIIIVNDGSTDNTKAIIENLIVKNIGMINLRLVNNKRNRGKGYSIKQGMTQSTGEVRIFMDADLPFSPMVIKKIFNRRYCLSVEDKFNTCRPCGCFCCNII